MGDDGFSDICLLGNKRMSIKGPWALRDIVVCVVFLIFENVLKIITSNVVSRTDKANRVHMATYVWLICG